MSCVLQRFLGWRDVSLIAQVCFISLGFFYAFSQYLYLLLCFITVYRYLFLIPLHVYVRKKHCKSLPSLHKCLKSSCNFLTMESLFFFRVDNSIIDLSFLSVLSSLWDFKLPSYLSVNLSFYQNNLSLKFFIHRRHFFVTLIQQRLSRVRLTS